MNDPNYEAVVRTVRQWPLDQRLSLVHEVLTTLKPSPTANRPHHPTLARALGLLATSDPAPSDEEIEAILDERRKRFET